MELTTKEWNDFLDKYLIEGITDDLESLECLNDYQKYCINEIKKAISRIKKK